MDYGVGFLFGLSEEAVKSVCLSIRLSRTSDFPEIENRGKL